MIPQFAPIIICTTFLLHLFIYSFNKFLAMCVIFHLSRISSGSNTSFNVVLMFFFYTVYIFLYLRGVTSNALLFAATAIKITRIRYNINYFQPKMPYIVYSFEMDSRSIFHAVDVRRLEFVRCKMRKSWQNAKGIGKK